MRGIVLHQPQHPPHDRIRQRRVPGGWLRLGPGEPGPEGRDDQQVQQPVQDDLLPRLVAHDLLHQERGQRALPHVGGERQQRRQRVQEPVADLALHQIRPDEDHRPAVEPVAPGAHPEVHGAVQGPPVGVAAFRAGQDQCLRGRTGVVGAGVGVGAAGDGEVAGAQPDPFARVGHDPGVATDHQHDRQRRPVLHPHRPRRVETRTDHEGATRPRSFQQACQSVHTASVDACAWE